MYVVEGVALGAEPTLGLVVLVEEGSPDGLGGRGARDAQVLVHELEEPPNDVLSIAVPVPVGVQRAVEVEEQHPTAALGSGLGWRWMMGMGS